MTILSIYYKGVGVVGDTDSTFRIIDASFGAIDTNVEQVDRLPGVLGKLFPIFVQRDRGLAGQRQLLELPAVIPGGLCPDLRKGQRASASGTWAGHLQPEGPVFYRYVPGKFNVVGYHLLPLLQRRVLSK